MPGAHNSISEIMFVHVTVMKLKFTPLESSRTRIPAQVFDFKAGPFSYIAPHKLGEQLKSPNKRKRNRFD